jgi:hypothetical protein
MYNEPLQNRPLAIMTEKKVFASYDEFFAFYLDQHRNAANRVLHAAGTSLGIVAVVLAIALHHPWLAFLWIPIAYGFAWTGHFLLEKNRPATFGYPLWSFISDFRMLWLMTTGRLGKWKARGSAPSL